MPLISGEINRSCVVSALHLPQKCPLLGEDELVLLREVEIGEAFIVGFQPRTVGLVFSETWKRDSPNAMLSVPSCGIQ